MKLNAFYTKYSCWAGILYSATAIIFLITNTYSNMWLLYMGNLMFSAIVLTAVIRSNHLVQDKASLNSLFLIGIKITFYGLLIASLISLLVLGISSLLTSREATLEESPSQVGDDARGDLVIALFITTVLVNAVLGSLAAVIGSSVVKRNQKTEQGKTIS